MVCTLSDILFLGSAVGLNIINSRPTEEHSGMEHLSEAQINPLYLAFHIYFHIVLVTLNTLGKSHYFSNS